MSYFFKKYKRYLLLPLDILAIIIAYVFSLYFITDGTVLVNDILEIGHKIIIASVTYIVVFICFGIYKRVWSIASVSEYIDLIGASVVSCILIVSYELLINSMNIKMVILAFFFILGLCAAIRVSIRLKSIMIHAANKKQTRDKRVLIVGAGQAGMIIVNELQKNDKSSSKIIGFIDDDASKKGCTISNVKVLGNRNDIENICAKMKIDEIIIAIPSLDAENKAEIVKICTDTSCSLKIIPAISTLVEKNIYASMRKVQVEDLLLRDPVKLDNKGINEYINGKTVLVTGVGSIGSELCRQIAEFSPKKLVMLDIYENNIYDIEQELNFTHPELKKDVIIASVRDIDRLDKVFESFKPEIVFHAAAHKHVPLMESSPQEAIKNNVFGTLNMAECASKHNVRRFVLISTDKAVNPTNIMGASKRLCEMIVQAMNDVSKTEFVAVRFGNVLDSNGSVLPLFKKQIDRGGPITLTHPEITRFFMTIPEAAQLVLQAGAFAKGGEIFVLDMGKPIKIYDLVKNFVKLSGLVLDVDIKVVITGLRPGEKLYEELLMAEEGLINTSNNKIYIGKQTFTNIDILRKELELLQSVIEKDENDSIKSAMAKIVPTYKPYYVNANTSENMPESEKISSMQI